MKSINLNSRPTKNGRAEERIVFIVIWFWAVGRIEKRLNESDVYELKAAFIT